jgi:hypothetical protein
MDFDNRADKASFTTMRAFAGKLKPTERHFFAAGDPVKKYAAGLRDEMTRRRLQFTPIESRASVCLVHGIHAEHPNVLAQWKGPFCFANAQAGSTAGTIRNKPA